MDRTQFHKFTRLVRQQANGCWYWTGPGTSDGYGVMPITNGRVMAHKASYEHYHGPIPPGMDVGHTCHDQAVLDGSCDGGTDCGHRRCVNPEHLAAQTRSENTLAQNHYYRNKDQCPKGHPYEGDNVIVRSNGKRQCRTCDRERKRKPKI